MKITIGFRQTGFFRTKIRRVRNVQLNEKSMTHPKFEFANLAETSTRQSRLIHASEKCLRVNECASHSIFFLIPIYQ